MIWISNSSITDYRLPRYRFRGSRACTACSRRKTSCSASGEQGGARTSSKKHTGCTCRRCRVASLPDILSPLPKEPQMFIRPLVKKFDVYRGPPDLETGLRRFLTGSFDFQHAPPADPPLPRTITCLYRLNDNYACDFKYASNDLSSHLACRQIIPAWNFPSLETFRTKMELSSFCLEREFAIEICHLLNIRRVG